MIDEGPERQPAERGSGSWVPLVVGAVLAVAAGIAIPLALSRQTGSVTMPSTLYWGVPVLIYAILRRLRQDDWSRIYSKLSLTRGLPAYYLWAVILAAGLIASYYLAVDLLLPPEARQVEFTPYSGLEISLLTLVLVFLSEALTVALGQMVEWRGELFGPRYHY